MSEFLFVCESDQHPNPYRFVEERGPFEGSETTACECGAEARRDYANEGSATIAFVWTGGGNRKGATDSA